MLKFVYAFLLFAFYFKIFNIINENYDDTYFCQNIFLIWLKNSSIKELILLYILICIFCIIYSMTITFILNKKIELYKIFYLSFSCLITMTVILYNFTLIVKLFVLNNCF